MPGADAGAAGCEAELSGPKIPASPNLWLKRRRLRVRVLTCADDGSHNGWWRSLVAHLTGGQGVAGSNPVHPTTKPQVRGLSLWPFSLGVLFCVLCVSCKTCNWVLLMSRNVLFRNRGKLLGERLRYASSCSIATSGMRQFARLYGAPKPACAHEVRPPFDLSPSHSGSLVDKCPRLCTQHTNHRPALCILGLGACEGTVASWGNSRPLRTTRTVGNRPADAARGTDTSG